MTGSVDNSVPSLLSLALPIPLTKFLTPVELSEQDFFSRWRQVGGAPRESQVVFQPGAVGLLDLQELERRVGGLGLRVLPGLDPSGNGVVAAGILNCVELGKVGCMVRLEVNKDHEVRLILSLFKLLINS